MKFTQSVTFTVEAFFKVEAPDEDTAVDIAEGMRLSDYVRECVRGLDLVKLGDRIVMMEESADWGELEEVKE